MKEYEKKMNGYEHKWKEHERRMKGKLKVNAKWKEDACKWKENDGTCIQMNAKWKEHGSEPL